MHENLDMFLKDFDEIKEHYKKTNNLNNLQKDLDIFSEKYSTHFGVGDYLLSVAEQYIEVGDYKAGILFVKAVYEKFKYVENKVDLYLRMAEYCLRNNEIETGTEFLAKLCTDTADNYEESIEFNELTEVWDKYKHLIEGKIPKSMSFNSKDNPLLPEKCSMAICEILALPDSKMLTELSLHIGELSANGECLRCLNKWEKNVFYADELCMEVNSGGFSNYLYYYGHHFEKAQQVFEMIQAGEMLDLMKSVNEKFPRKKIPKKLESIQNALDKMEEKEIDFETEDEIFYANAEKELLEKLKNYILENKEHFR